MDLQIKIFKKKEEEKLKELNDVKDSFEKKIKLDLLENNNCSKLTNDSLPENTNKTEILEDKSLPIENSNQENNHHSLNPTKGNIWRIRKSLYTKLVENEELQENMIILQAIKHLVEYHNIK
ncbi:unnamed protein product [Pneumocystis jirovecii]|uniref:Uncharacterized protein n=1 Tax=Pneumocystis jirovecii TaxID=42068 RepID=L0P8N7_PNEJI|nr:unnamed protein product [Pneumocystis jirovecii]